METDKIEEVMDLVLESIKGSIENDQVAIAYLDAANRLIATLFYVHSGLEKLPAEIELLKAEAERAKMESPTIKYIAEKVAELLNDV